MTPVSRKVDGTVFRLFSPNFNSTFKSTQRDRPKRVDLRRTIQIATKGRDKELQDMILDILVPRVHYYIIELEI